MNALRWYGTHDVRIETVADPQIIDPRDVIIKVTLTAICGSDLHIYDGYIPTMEKGDILGHEFMGEVTETGPEVKNLKEGDRVVIPFPIACGNCFFCKRGEFSLCDNSNPNPGPTTKLYGYKAGGLFGYSHMFGGFPGGQAEFVRVPYADVSAVKVPPGLEDEKVIFLTDIFPTGYQAALNCGIQGGDAVAVWGCGPVGQFSIRSAFMLGAAAVIAIDRVPERLEMAAKAGAKPVNYEKADIYEVLREATDGRGPASCIDAVGMEAQGTGIVSAYDKAKQIVKLQTDRPTTLRQAILACRKGGTVSIPGVYGGFIDKFNIGAAFGKGLTLRMGQTHAQRYIPALLEKIVKGEADPSFVISHRLKLDDAPKGYKMFRNKEDKCIKIVMRP